MQYVTAYIGLGSNLLDPKQQVLLAHKALGTISHTRTEARSNLYRSKAVGPKGQPDYINAVTRVSTLLDPLALLEALQQIEDNQQRVRRERWGPRTIDLDLLLFGDATIETDRLTVPHPQMKHRNFVLKPLLDIAPQLIFPNGETVVAALAQLGMADLTRLSRQDAEVR